MLLMDHVGTGTLKYGRLFIYRSGCSGWYNCGKIQPLRSFEKKFWASKWIFKARCNESASTFSFPLISHWRPSSRSMMIYIVYLGGGVWHKNATLIRHVKKSRWRWFVSELIFSTKYPASFTKTIQSYSKSSRGQKERGKKSKPIFVLYRTLSFI